MIDLVTPRPELPLWHWHVEPREDIRGQQGAPEHVEGLWPAEQPDHIARFIAWQMVDMDSKPWVIRVWLGTCVGQLPALEYTPDEHHAWVLGVPVGDPLMVEIKRALNLAHDARLDVGQAARTLPDLGVPVTAQPAMDTPELDPALDFHTTTERVMRRIESVTDESGMVDGAKVLAMHGQSLVMAMHGILQHQEVMHGDEDFTYCADSARAMAKFASLYVVAYVTAGGTL